MLETQSIGADESIEADELVRRLYVRLALLRERIDRLGYRYVRTLAASDVATADFRCITVNAATCDAWRDVEPILIFYRMGTYWALQEGCPHANISLRMADIEDFRPDFPTTHGPCLSCPAHSYVFDVGSGDCLTNRHTPPARTYDVQVSPAETSAEGAAFHVWVCQVPKQPALHAEPSGPLSLEVGNAIQLKLVEAALRRKFGDSA